MAVSRNHSQVNSSSVKWQTEIPIHLHELLRLSFVLGNVIAVSLICGIAVRRRNITKNTGKFLLILLFSKRVAIFRYATHLVNRSVYVVAIAVAVAAYLASSKSAVVSRHTDGRSSETDGDFLKPLIFPCRTTHTRFFPIKHSFSYSYLFVGIPIGWNNSAGSLLSTDQSTKRTWFSVSADDYLARGNVAGGLKAKLDTYLSSVGVLPAFYRYAYLVSAPRFLGFSFNPVSFWYLYDEQKTLVAMILEVNNTFDERRMYFMKQTSVEKGATRNFTKHWTKDFHVSPFNDRDGSYSLTAKDIAFNINAAMVDNNLVLRSNEGKAKIVARVFSTQSAINPSTMSTLQSYSFLLRWWWVGFMTNPRILREAKTLWFKKLQVFHRPEVLASSIGRNETAEETGIEPFFREYLHHLVRKHQQDIVVLYIPAAGPERGKQLSLGAKRNLNDDAVRLHIKILTPSFYSELVRAKSVRHAFDGFCCNPAPGAKMVEVSDITTLALLLEGQTPASTGYLSGPALLRYPHVFLRKDTLGTTMEASSMAGDQKTNSTVAHLTDFDNFIVTKMPLQQRKYTYFAAKTLLADRLALGFMPLLDLYAIIVEFGLLWWAAYYATKVLQGKSTIMMLLRSDGIMIILSILQAIFETPA